MYPVVPERSVVFAGIRRTIQDPFDCTTTAWSRLILGTTSILNHGSSQLSNNEVGQSLCLSSACSRMATVTPNFISTRYECKAITATGHDGVPIPMSMVYRRDLVSEGPNYVYLDGYGAYGICFDPDFDFKRLPLLDRGVVYVIAHIRGGGEVCVHADRRQLR